MCGDGIGLVTCIGQLGSRSTTRGIGTHIARPIVGGIAPLSLLTLDPSNPKNSLYHQQDRLSVQSDAIPSRLRPVKKAWALDGFAICPMLVSKVPRSVLCHFLFYIQTTSPHSPRPSRTPYSRHRRRASFGSSLGVL